MSLARPFNFSSQLNVGEKHWDWVPWLDAMCIAVAFLLLGSRFVFAPGVSLDLQLDLPETHSVNMVGTPTDAVLTVAVLSSKKDNMHIFNGSIVPLQRLEATLTGYLQGRDVRGNAVLLVKVDKRVSTGVLMQIAEMARRGGFARVQIATDAARVEEDSFQSFK